MPKTDRNPAELKRQVRLLLALDGRALRLADGLWLVRDGRLRDVHTLRALLQRPGVARNELKACFTEGTHCEPLSRQHLAAATHALAVLQMHVDELEDTPARWLAGQRRDRAWLAAQRQRVQRLSAWMGAPTNGDALAAWFDGAPLPPLDARGEALAWLCDTPPTHAAMLDGCDDGVFAQALSRITTHGPREADVAAALTAATSIWPADALDAWWSWLARGVDPRAVACWPPASRARAAPPADWPLDAVGVYLRLTAALLRTPGGGRLNLAPDQFARLAGGRSTTLLALASALDQVLRSDPGAIEQTLALADSALRLDARWSAAAKRRRCAPDSAPASTSASSTGWVTRRWWTATCRFARLSASRWRSRGGCGRTMRPRSAGKSSAPFSTRCPRTIRGARDWRGRLPAIPRARAGASPQNAHNSNSVGGCNRSTAHCATRWRAPWAARRRAGTRPGAMRRGCTWRST
ncbi:MAG: hypothetical protein IPK27_02705 [Rhodanobacteraceae bacterium]|nr:hypothetical protein [Rhodanobacteraceae bacterium]